MPEAATQKPPTTVELVWVHDLVLSGRAGDQGMTIDSDSAEGPSPMQALAFGLAGCMAIDVIHILRKGRHDLRGLKADLTATRAPEPPRRFMKIDLHYTITGNLPEDPVARAVDLSREKYCSVWHSMRQDLEFSVSFSISSGA